MRPSGPGGSGPAGTPPGLGDPPLSRSLPPHPLPAGPEPGALRSPLSALLLDGGVPKPLRAEPPVPHPPLPAPPIPPGLPQPLPSGRWRRGRIPGGDAVTTRSGRSPIARGPRPWGGSPGLWGCPPRPPGALRGRRAAPVAAPLPQIVPQTKARLRGTPEHGGAALGAAQAPQPPGRAPPAPLPRPVLRSLGGPWRAQACPQSCLGTPNLGRGGTVGSCPGPGAALG